MDARQRLEVDVAQTPRRRARRQGSRAAALPVRESIMPKTDDVYAGISSDAVRAKTGRTWKEWFAVLDKAGAGAWPHKDIARHLHDKCDCPDWWSQMVTVGYEQARGLRVRHQKCDGEFSASVSKTLSVPVSALFAAWNEPKLRAKWLAGAKG